MKKTKILIICTLILVFTCLIFAGCRGKEEITSISLKDEEVIEIAIGKLDYSAHSLLVNYSSGSVVEVPLDESMFSELDLLKLYQPGQHVITASYSGEKCQINVSVKRDTFGELKFSENNVFTYDGTAHTVELEGDLPANATVSYLGGNSFVNAGTYDVTAVVTCDGYETARITTKVTIERAKYDMSGVTFESKKFTYDGKSHFVQISGKLPAGVSDPTYYIGGNKVSSVVDAGVYNVTAVFTTKDPNYAPVDDMHTTLTILPLEYDLDGIGITFKAANGTSLIAPWRTYDGTSIKFELYGLGALAKNATVSYTVMDESGDVISRSNIDTKIVNAGRYTIRVEFKLLDGKNYKEIEPMEFTFDVDKAKFDTSKLEFESVVAEYDGQNHSLTVSFPRGFDTSKVDVKYEYILNGEAVLENGENVNGVTNAGEYTVNAIFTVNDENYESIEPMQAVLIINKKQIVSSLFDFGEDTPTVVTKGDSATFEFLLESMEGISVKAGIYKVEESGLTVALEPKDLTPDENGKTVIELETTELEAGAYACIFTVSIISENYVLSMGTTSLEYRFNFEIN